MTQKSDHFVFFSLHEKEADSLANTLGNKTSRHILKYLSDTPSATESEIAERLKLPMSTVHYNIKNLIKAKLVKAEEFHYSKKGREVNHYSLAKKYIIIAPDEEESTFKKLKSLLISIFALVGVSFATTYYKFLNLAPEFSGTLAKTATDEAINMVPTSELVPDIARESADNISANLVEPSFLSHFPLEFFLGGVLVIIIILIIKFYKARK
jgi:DNA-binding transcriptional ArsR family regulator